jgi:exodeoxyribonuclease X
MSVYLIDSETTGLSPNNVIELSYIKMSEDIVENSILNIDWEDFKGAAFSQRYCPDMDIHPKASEIHGLYWKDLKNCPSHKEIKLPEDCEILLGHNTLFDWRSLGKPKTLLLCTMQLSKKLYPEIKEKGGYSLRNLINVFYP